MTFCLVWEVQEKCWVWGQTKARSHRHGTKAITGSHACFFELGGNSVHKTLLYISILHL